MMKMSVFVGTSVDGFIARGDGAWISCGPVAVTRMALVNTRGT